MDSNIECWYSMKEICEYLGVSRDTVLAWIDKREMPATKIGRHHSAAKALEAAGLGIYLLPNQTLVDAYTKCGA